MKARIINVAVAVLSVLLCSAAGHALGWLADHMPDPDTPAGTIIGSLIFAGLAYAYIKGGGNDRGRRRRR